MSKDSKNMCHNIRFRLGEYSYVSAKMCLGACADGSQFGRTYDLLSRRAHSDPFRGNECLSEMDSSILESGDDDAKRGEATPPKSATK